MKHNTKFLLFFMVMALLSACGKSESANQQVMVRPETPNPKPKRPEEPRPQQPQKEEERKKKEEPAPPPSANENGLPPSVFSSSAAVDSKNDSAHLLIRRANLTFRAKKAIYASLAIEELTEKFGGYVATTQISQIPINQFINPISKDSCLEVSKFQIRNEITIRVPKQKLDSTLRAMSTLAEQLDHRTIETENVAFKLISNNLAQERNAKYQQRVGEAVDNGNIKQDQRAMLAESALSQQTNADNAKLANLEVMDNVQLSTVKISVYERESIKEVMIENPNRIEQYEPSFFVQIWQALVEGFVWVKSLFLMLIRLWAFFLVLFGGFLAWRKWKLGKKI